MIIIEFGGNTLGGSSQSTNEMNSSSQFVTTLQKPEKLENANSLNCHSQAETTVTLLENHTTHQQTISIFSPLRRWIEENFWNN